MDQAQFATEFITNNLTKVFELGKSFYGILDGNLQLLLKTAYND